MRPAARRVAEDRISSGERGRSIYRDGRRIDLSVRPGVRLPVGVAALAGVAARALTMAQAPERASIALILSDDRELASLNATHMGHDGPTDVLSFPLLPPTAFPPHAAAAPTAEHAAARFVLPPGRRVHLGDVVLSVERAVAQAVEGRGGQTGDVRWSVADELRLLVVHGALHVCGWDHEEPAEERAMRDLERRILAPV